MATREKITYVIDAKYTGKANVQGATKDVKGLDAATQKTTKSFSNMATGLAKGAAAFAAVGIAGKAVLDFSKESIKLFGIQEKAEAQLAATIKSTGSAAGVTAKEMREYASALQSTTTFGDEAIIGAESLLLTFTNIGGPVLKDATATVLDMSQALGQDLKSSSIQIGKALNDPIKGLTALSRVGVSFTEQQKEQIKTMQEMGDVAGAQQLILAELNKEFGGSAAAAVDTYDGKIQQLSNTYGDLQEEIGEAITRQGGFVTQLNTGLGAVTANVAMWNTLQNAMDDGFFSQKRLNEAQAEGNEALAELADEYLEYQDILEQSTAQAEQHDKVLIGLESTVIELVGGFGDVTEAEHEFMKASSEAAFANSELSDKVQQLSHHMTEEEALIYNANAALRAHGDAATETAGKMEEPLSLTARINAEIDRLNAQPKDFNFNMSVSGLESLREAVRLAGQMGGAQSDMPDPFAGGDDRPTSERDPGAAFDRLSDQTFGTAKPTGGSRPPTNVNFAMGANDFKVPPGFPGDSFIMGVSSGEIVNVDNGRSGGRSGGVTIQGPLIGQVVQNAGENGAQFAARVSGMVTERIGALT